MTTNELEGRALAEAAARAMGCKVSDGVSAFQFPGENWRGFLADPLTERECLAWLHERGEVAIYSNSRQVSASLWLPVITGAMPMGHGSDILEALQRLVVAVAAREQAAKGEP